MCTAKRTHELLSQTEYDEFLCAVAMLYGAEFCSDQLGLPMWRFKVPPEALPEALVGSMPQKFWSGGYSSKAKAADMYLSQIGIFVTRDGEIVHRGDNVSETDR